MLSVVAAYYQNTLLRAEIDLRQARFWKKMAILSVRLLPGTVVGTKPRRYNI